ncbi:MAG: DNA/RNA non-specific endonuclease [Candidatus Eisenbacteria sp.]|nr:DNA/RNA non-specific endonuclease [Candidatus Eisenbacteria bacterium]
MPVRSLGLALSLCAVLAFGSASAQRPEIHCKHFFFGYPYGTPEANDLVIRDPYALSNNDETKFADWVAYRLDPWTVAARSDACREWHSDPWLDPDETLEDDDYDHAHSELGTDRGHQAPLASFRGDPDWWQTNYLSNITPQSSGMNQGPWMRLEEAVRDIVREWRVVWVMTGPLYEQEMDPLPEADEDHTIPSGYWKIVAIGEIGDPTSVRATAFVMDQDTPRQANYQDYIVSIDEIEQRTGLDFFWALPAYMETQVESAVGVWPPQ